MKRLRVGILTVLDWVWPLLISIAGAARATLGTPADPPVGLIASLHARFIEHFLGTIIVLAGLSIATKAGLALWNSELKRRTKAVLDVIHNAYFVDVPEAKKHHNRVTLFKANRRRTALIPYCRSGTQYPRGTQRLAISDDDEEANEGVAGKAWFLNGSVTRDGLPEPPKRWDDADETCREYAASGFLPVKKAAKLKIKSLGVFATVVRDYRGERWGVLVLDSREPGAITASRLPHVESLAAALGKLV